MPKDNQFMCLYVMTTVLVLNLAVIIWDRQVRKRVLYGINALLAVIEIAAYLVLVSLPPGWGTDYPHLIFLPFLWLGSFMGVVLLSYLGIWNFLSAHRRTWWGKTGMALWISAHIALLAFALFILVGALFSFRWG